MVTFVKFLPITETDYYHLKTVWLTGLFLESDLGGYMVCCSTMRSLFPMTEPFVLSPRYRLDDEWTWFVGVDPSRHYWMMVNGEEDQRVMIPGLFVTDGAEWKQTIQRFRALQPTESMEIERLTQSVVLYCVSSNCYAIASEMAGAPVWHLFDRETLESLLMTSHPDWQCSPQDLELGRELLQRAFAQPASV